MLWNPSVYEIGVQFYVGNTLTVTFGFAKHICNEN